MYGNRKLYCKECKQYTDHEVKDSLDERRFMVCIECGYRLILPSEWYENETDMTFTKKSRECQPDFSNDKIVINVPFEINQNNFIKFAWLFWDVPEWIEIEHYLKLVRDGKDVSRYFKRCTEMLGYFIASFLSENGNQDKYFRYPRFLAGNGKLYFKDKVLADVSYYANAYDNFDRCLNCNGYADITKSYGPVSRILRSKKRFTYMDLEFEGKSRIHINARSSRLKKRRLIFISRLS